MRGTSRNDARSFGIQVAALAGLAVAPLYELLSSAPTFFVAHDSGAGDILLVTGVAAFAWPLAVGIVGSTAWRVLHPRRWIVIAGLLVPLLVLNLLPLTKRLLGEQPVTVVTFAVLASVAIGWAYPRSAAIRSFLSLLVLGSVALPIVFLAREPIRGLWTTTGPEASAGVQVSHRPPIVFIVVDELPLTSLLDDDLHIDARLFPNLAALASTSTWFRGYTSSHATTVQAVTTILTSRSPGDASVAPTATSYPDNLFTLLGGSYHVNAREPVTHLCPETICDGRTRPDSPVRLRRLIGDLEVVLLNILLPSAQRFGIPPMSDRWADFAISSVDATAHFEDQLRDLASHRVVQFEKYLADLDAIDDGNLLFIHLMLPHVPFNYFPSGRRYTLADRPLDGNDNERWGEAPYPAALGYQRHLLQAGFVDSLLGRAFETLRKRGTFDDALILIVSDHGASFRPALERREPVAETAGDIAPVPLLLKLPHQREGIISDVVAQSRDILPTLLAALGAKSTPTMEGRDLFSEGVATQPRVMHRSDLTPIPLADDVLPLLRAGVARKAAVFGPIPSWSSLQARVDNAPSLIGRAASSFPSAPISDVYLTLRNPQLFHAVTPDGPYLPALIEGTLDGDVGTAPAEIAIALNGVIGATVPLLAADDRQRFVALVPESVFDATVIDVVAYLIRRGHDGEVLLARPTQGRLGETLQITTDASGGRAIVGNNGTRYAVVEGALRASLDLARIDGDALRLVGWAADPTQLQPADAILFFLDGRHIATILPTDRRDDVNAMLGAEPSMVAGFSAWVPLTTLGGPPEGALRAFAVQRSGRASEVVYAQDYPCEQTDLPPMLWSPSQLLMDSQSVPRATAGRAGEGEASLNGDARGSSIRGSHWDGDCLEISVALSSRAANTDPHALLLFASGRLLATRDLRPFLKSSHATEPAAAAARATAVTVRLPRRVADGVEPEALSVVIVETMEITTDAGGGRAIVGNNGTRYAVVEGALRASLDLARIDGDALRLVGWAADPTHFQPADAILFFLDDRHIATVLPTDRRDDVNAMLGADPSMLAGFSASLPLTTLGGPPEGTLRAFAVQRSGRASEVVYAQDYPCEQTDLPPMLWSPSQLLMDSQSVPRAIAGRAWDGETRLNRDARGSSIRRSHWNGDCLETLVALSSRITDTDPHALLLFASGRLLATRDLRPLLNASPATEPAADATRATAVTVRLPRKVADGVEAEALSGVIVSPKAPPALLTPAP